MEKYMLFIACIKKVSKLSFLILAILLLRVDTSIADVLKLDSSFTYNAKIEGGFVHLNAEIYVKNVGNQKVLESFPSLKIENWEWAGDPIDLEINQSKTWTFNEKFSSKELKCQESCSELELPLKGKIPVLAFLHYSDLNYYEFTFPHIDVLNFSKSRKRQLVDFRASLSLENKNSNSTGTLNIQNFSSEDKKLHLSFHTSRELRMITKPQIVEVPAKGIATRDISLTNFNGLLGNAYPLYTILKWENKDERETIFMRNTAIVTKKEIPFLTLVPVISILASCFLLFLIFKFRSKS